MRAFNLRCGITPDLERPSKRYGSIPIDGPAKGQDVGANWERLVRPGTRRWATTQRLASPRRDATRTGSGTSHPRPLGREGSCTCLNVMYRQRPRLGQVEIEAVAWVTKFVGGDGSTRRVYHESLKAGDTVRRVLRRLSGRFPELHKALWDAQTATSASISKCWLTTRCWTSPNPRQFDASRRWTRPHRPVSGWVNTLFVSLSFAISAGGYGGP